MSLSIGDPAPLFSLLDEHEQLFELKQQLGDKLLLVFYPGDNTPVCTKQLCDYRDGIEAFADLGVQIIGISNDDAESHKRFKAQYKLPFILLTDSDLAVADEYGCKSMLGMKRGLFLLDEAGIIRYQHVENLALFRRSREEVLTAIADLSKF